MNCQTSIVVNKVFLILLVFVIFPVSACQPTKAMESVISESPLPVQPTRTPTKIPTTAVPTEVPTETPLPTNTATITHTPKPKLGPEKLATTIENVAGKWVFMLAGSSVDAAVLTLTLEGTTSMDGIAGEITGMNVGRGEYWFEDNVMVWYSEDCSTPTSAKPFICTAKYQVYYAIGDNGVGSLRFIAVDDPNQDRKKCIHGRTLFPTELE